MGPDIKTTFPHDFKTLKRTLKSFFVHSDCWRVVSFVPTWTTILFTETGSEGSKSRSLSVMTGTVAPGKQRVMVFAKRIPLVMESPMINVVGGKRGRGDVGRVSGQDRRRAGTSTGIETETAGLGWGGSADGEVREGGSA